MIGSDCYPFKPQSGGPAATSSPTAVQLQEIEEEDPEMLEKEHVLAVEKKVTSNCGSDLAFCLL